MEAEEIQNNGCRFSRANHGNGRRSGSDKVGQNDEDDGEQPRRGAAGGVLGDAALMTGVNESCDGGRLRGWSNSSRIIRVSRTSGGKDRHSKVWTSRGPRDRRIRLSVSTAIQFYDLQDRLGYDQPSKAVEWLIEAAKEPIGELPSLTNTANQPSAEKFMTRQKGFDFADAEFDGGSGEAFQQQQHPSMSKSACSSTSETSKGSGLSLSRTDVRVNREKARERARERTSKDKERESTDHHHHHHHVNASFTELLSGSIGTNSAPMEYFNTGLLAHRPPHSSGQTQLGSSLPHLSSTMSIPAAAFSVAGDNQPEPQHFSLVPDHLIPASSQSGSDYNVNFAISSAFNRGGTLQSNCPPLWPHIQRYSPADGSNIPFFVGAPMPVESHQHHQFPSGFDGRLQLCYADGSRLSDHKGKGKD